MVELETVSGRYSEDVSAFLPLFLSLASSATVLLS